MHRQLLPLLAACVLAVGCFPVVTGAPCVNDSNCPSDQRCVAQVCSLADGGEGTGGAGGGSTGGGGGGGGSATGGGGSATGGGGSATGGGGSATGGGGSATGGGGSATGGGGGATGGGGGGATDAGDDAGLSDAGMSDPDAGLDDAGIIDAGLEDAGVPDAGQADTEAPVVVQTTPTTGSTNVSTATTIQFVFSEPMNPSSVLYVFAPSITFSGSVWGSGNTVLTLVPSAPLAFSTGYSVSVIGSDVAGNAISPPYSYSFTTEGAPDTTAPTVVSTAPATGSTDVPSSSGFLVTFSEPMNPASVQLASTPSLTLTAPSWAANNTELSIGPVSPMAASTQHTVTLTGNDVAGNALAPNTSFTFTTAAPPDTTPPTLMSSTPVANAMNVTISTRLSLTFSEPMNTASLVLDPTPDPTLGVPTWSNGDRTVTFNAPASDWPTATDVSVLIDGSDVAGNALVSVTLLFRTAAPADTTPPTVNSTAPSSGATGVPNTTNLEFNFSEPMQQAATQAAFSSSPAITCSFTWNAANTLMVCNPNSNLNTSTTYTVTLGTGARDTAGNTLAAAFSLPFTTAAAPDTTRPTVTATNPLNNAVGVPRQVSHPFPQLPTPSTIRVSFSEAMSQSAVQGAFSVTSPAGFNGGTFTWSSNTMTYTPPAFFAYGQQVNFQIGTGATDLAGNPLASTYSSTFRIRRRSTANFTNTTGSSSLDGYVYGTSGCGTLTANAGSSVAPAGDSSANLIYRGFLTFSLASLTSLVDVSIASATLNTYQTGCYGTPFTSTFGAIEAWHVNYGPSLETTDCSTGNLGSRQYTLSTSTAVGIKSVSVTSSVSDDWTNRGTRGNRSQFMLRTANLATDGDAAYDYCSQATYNAATTSNRPYLSITYEYD